MRAASVALLLGAGVCRAACAASLDDLLDRGYTVVAATRLPGAFNGCVRQHRLVFADGSVFACAQNAGQTAFEPRVLILRLGGEPPSVVLVGSAVVAGELLRLRLHDYPVPLRMNADPLDGAAGPSMALQPLRAVASLNVLDRALNAPLAEQQVLRPARPAGPRPGR